MENNKYKESIIESNENSLSNNNINNESLNSDEKHNSENSEEKKEELNDDNNNEHIISENNENDNNESKEYKKKPSIMVFKEKEITCKPAKSKEDFIYKKKFFSEEWFKRSNYIDIDLVQDHLSSFKYLWNEIHDLESLCSEQLFKHAMSKPNLFESKNVRNIVRNGIPPKYMNQFLLKLFNISKNPETLINNYNKILLISLKGFKSEFLEDYVPFFSGLNKLNDSLPVHYLNKSGILALKEILWMLFNLYPQIEFCPLIIQILSLILVFCNKYEALEIMSCIICFNINYDKDELYKIRWHFRLDYNENIKIITSISDCLKEVSYKSGKELYNHLTSIHFRPEKLYEDICFGFFYKYLNFFGMIKFLPFYLHEGIKSVYRLIYAIEKLTKGELLLIKIPDKIIPLCRDLINSLDNIKDLFEISYSFNITRNNNKYLEQNDINSNDKRIINYKEQYILPDIENKSVILNEYQIIRLWENMPKSFKTKKADIFQFKPTQSNISEIIKTFKNENMKFIFLIKTNKKEIFGFAFHCSINETDGNFLKLNKGFLFSIEPVIKIYNINSECSELLYIDKDQILIGKDFNDIITLKISGDLSKGETHEGECFNNQNLVNNEEGHFEIEMVEIFKLF